MAANDMRERWLACARRGAFAEAWQISDALLLQPQPATLPRHYQSVWRGGSLEDRRVLIRCYHGLGDTIQFIRYLPLAAAIAREVVVWAPARLVPLIAAMGAADRVLELHDGGPGAAYDVDVEVMELAHVFRSTIETIPRRVPYLPAAPRPLPGRAPRVGLFWRGGGWDPARWLPFAIVRQLLDIDRVTWCSLQGDPAPDEADPRLLELGDGSLVDLASRVAGLELVISVDSMPAHLAGALGVPVWTLLRHHADWRWMEDRDDSPWYPTMRLFRQPRDGDWDPVVARVAAALRGWQASSPEPAAPGGRPDVRAPTRPDTRL